MERRVSLRQLLAEAVEDQLSLNATLPRTLAALLFRPGFLSREYLAGRIQRYIPPFRLYLACSVVFFLLLSFEASRSVVRVGNGDMADAKMVVNGDTLLVAARIDSLRRGTRQAVRTGWPRLDSVANRRTRELLALPPDERFTELRRIAVQRAPTTMFFMVPIFAVLLQVLYFRRKRYYVEHFVYALHTHAFAFLMFVPIMLAKGSGWIAGTAMSWLLLYNLLALKRYYGQGLFRTLAKGLLLCISYSSVLTFGVTATIAVALLLS